MENFIFCAVKFTSKYRLEQKYSNDDISLFLLRQVFQIAAKCDSKLRHFFQIIAKVIIQTVLGITKCDRYFKSHWYISSIDNIT